MRIGILTIPLRTNYGGLLQAYALQTVLERMGHKAIVLDKRIHESLAFWKMPLAYGKRIIKKLQGKECVLFYEWRFNKEFPIISQFTQPFIDKHIRRIEVSDFGKLQEKDLMPLSWEAIKYGVPNTIRE